MDDNDINKIFSQEDLSKLSEEERREIEVEGMQLAQGKLYMVLSPDGETKVSVRCYDSTGESLTTAAHIMLKGLLTIMETSHEEVMKLGHECILWELLHDLNEGDDTSEKKSTYEVSDNIIKVTFPKGDRIQ